MTLSSNVLMRYRYVAMIDFLNNHWGFVLAVCGAITAVTKFVRDMLTIRKLRREVAVIKAKEGKDRAIISTPTFDQVVKYSNFPKQGLRESEECCPNGSFARYIGIRFGILAGLALGIAFEKSGAPKMGMTILWGFLGLFMLINAWRTWQSRRLYVDLRGSAINWMHAEGIQLPENHNRT